MGLGHGSGKGVGVNDNVLCHPPLSHTAEQGLDEVVKILGARHDVKVNSKDVTCLWPFAAILHHSISCCSQQIPRFDSIPR